MRKPKRLPNAGDRPEQETRTTEADEDEDDEDGNMEDDKADDGDEDGEDDKRLTATGAAQPAPHRACAPMTLSFVFAVSDGACGTDVR